MTLTIKENGKYYSNMCADEDIMLYLPTDANLFVGVNLEVGTLEDLVSYCHKYKDMDGMIMLSRLAVNKATDKDVVYTLCHVQDEYIVFNNENNNELFLSLEDIERVMSRKEIQLLNEGGQDVFTPENTSTLIKLINDKDKHDALVDILEEHIYRGPDFSYLIQKVGENDD